MKIRVIRSFRDKLDKNIHQAGDVLDFDNSRAEDVARLGYGEIIKEEPKPRKKRTKNE